MSAQLRGWRSWGVSQVPAVHTQRLTAHPSFSRGLASCQRGVSSQWQRWLGGGGAEVWPAEAASHGAASHRQSRTLSTPACWWAAANCLEVSLSSRGRQISVLLTSPLAASKKSEVCLLLDMLNGCALQKERFSFPFLFLRGPLEEPLPSPATQQLGAQALGSEWNWRHTGASGPSSLPLAYPACISRNHTEPRTAEAVWRVLPGARPRETKSGSSLNLRIFLLLILQGFSLGSPANGNRVQPSKISASC